MPFEITWESHGVYKRFWGMASDKEYAETQDIVYGDARADRIRYMITDFLAVEGFDYTKQNAEKLAAITLGPSLSNPNVRVAFLTSDENIIALIEHLSHISSYEMRVFPTLAEARKWLDSDVPLEIPHRFS